MPLIFWKVEVKKGKKISNLISAKTQVVGKKYFSQWIWAMSSDTLSSDYIIRIDNFTVSNTIDEIFVLEYKFDFGPI